MTSVLFLFVLTLASAACISSPEVTTHSGRLRGRYVQTRDNRTVQAFLGVPFAQPPVGSLRFEVRYMCTRVNLAKFKCSACLESLIYLQSKVFEGECILFFRMNRKTKWFSSKGSLIYYFNIFSNCSKCSVIWHQLLSFI